MPILYWQDDETGQTEFVELDATQSEEHEDTLTITDHPVERGANVVDHAREEPTRFTLEGIVSSIPNPRIDTDTAFVTTDLLAPVMLDSGSKTVKLNPPKPPLEPSLSGLIQAGASAVVGAVTGGPNMNAQLTADPRRSRASIKAQSLQQKAPRNRVRDVYDLLLKAQSRRLLVTVQTRYREHFDMLIERIAVPRSVEDGSSAQFQIDLKRIRVSDSQTVAAPKPAEARGAGWVNRGSQAAKPASPEAAAKFESITSSLVPSSKALP